MHRVTSQLQFSFVDADRHFVSNPQRIAVGTIQRLLRVELAEWPHVTLWLEMSLGERIPGPDPMYPSAIFARFKMSGPYYVPFLSQADTAWVVLRRIHLVPDPRGTASTAIFNHRARLRLENITPLQATSEDQLDDLSDDDLASPYLDTSYASDDDAAAMDVASDPDYPADDDDDDH
jgi:hypothetical protein